MLPCATLFLLSLPLMMSLGSGSESGYFLVGPDMAVEGVSNHLAESWEVGTSGIATASILPCPSPNAVLHHSCIFVWRLSSEMTISMRQRLAELRQRQRGGKQQGPTSPQRASGPKQ